MPLSQREELHKEQLGDTMLKKCWENNCSGRFGILTSDGLRRLWLSCGHPRLAHFRLVRLAHKSL